MSNHGEHNLAGLAELSFERRGDYPSLLFEGRWPGSGELFERAQRIAAALVELGVKPGRVIGELLEALLDAVTSDPSMNQRERLIEKARELLQEKAR